MQLHEAVQSSHRAMQSSYQPYSVQFSSQWSLSQLDLQYNAMRRRVAHLQVRGCGDYLRGDAISELFKDCQDRAWSREA